VSQKAKAKAQCKKVLLKLMELNGSFDHLEIEDQKAMVQKCTADICDAMSVIETIREQAE
jgi:hypothetical protein